MHRLTIDKPVCKMSMIELAHNSCYIKDGKARFRDFENDFDARELTRKILEDLADDAFIDNTEETFDNVITDYLQYGISELIGLIAVFYRNLWAMADLRERLKKYEDLEEQGKLIKEWTPSEEPPASGKYVLLSFENFSNPLVGRYEEDEDGGGTYYVGDDEKSCINQDIIVNAWMPLPELYKN